MTIFIPTWFMLSAVLVTVLCIASVHHGLRGTGWLVWLAGLLVACCLVGLTAVTGVWIVRRAELPDRGSAVQPPQSHFWQQDAGRSSPAAAPAAAVAPGIEIDAGRTREESVNPAEDRIRLAADLPAPSQGRPDWVDAPARRVGNVERRVLSAGPYPTLDDCHELLDEKIAVVVGQHLAELTGRGDAPDLAALGLSASAVRQETFRDEYVETTDHSFGPMHTVHVMLEFDQNLDRQLLQRYQSYQRVERLAGVSLVSGATLGLLGLVYGLLKVDRWTGRVYTKRLLIGVPAVLAIAIAVALIA